jgi:uncharacterized Zn-binding protein involved in type VI secretion
MPGVMRIGDPNVSGGIILTGEFSVRANGRPVATIGAKVSPHPPCGTPAGAMHCKAMTTLNQATVRAGGKPLTSAGSIDSCGHVRIVGSPDVRIGG